MRSMMLARAPDGPFAETKELLAGFRMIQTRSRAEALEWAFRVPFTDGEVVEVRQVFEASRRRRASPRGQVSRWNGTSTTTTPRRNRSAPFTSSAVWLCSRCCHHRRGTNSGMTIVTTEFASRSRMRPT